MTVTSEEAAFGFTTRTDADGRTAIVAELCDGLYAVKACAPGGSVVYQVCNGALQQLYPAASSLEELRRRFAEHRGEVSGSDQRRRS